MKAVKEKKHTSENNHLFLQKRNRPFLNAQSFFSPNTIQAKLTIGQPRDQYEREADAMADQVVHQLSGPDNVKNATGGSPTIQKKCAACDEKEGSTIMRKSNGSGGLASTSLNNQLNGSKGGGHKLSNSTHREMSSAFGRDFSRVRIHTGSKAIQMNRGLNARAFTHRSDIYFNRGEYNTTSTKGKRLLAHELTHVIQQTGSPSIQRRSNDTPNIQLFASVHNSCTAHNQFITAAETEGRRMTRSTINTLGYIKSFIPTQQGPIRAMPRQTTYLMNTFGNVGGLQGGGGMSYIQSLISRYERINTGFNTRNIRCDTQTIANNACNWRSAFVVVGNRNDIFLCPNFFTGSGSSREKAMAGGQTLIHELAHSVLGASHEGIAEGVFPATTFDCNSPMGLTYDQAKRNAFAYGILANCLHGSRPVGAQVTVSAPPTSGANQSRGNHGWLGAGLGALGGGLIGGLIGGLAGGGLIGGLIGAGIGLATGAIVGGVVGSQFERE